MFKLSTRSTYGLRAVIDLANQQPDTIVKIGDIVKRQNVPRFYLEQILVKLRHAGTVNAIRGPKGGYSLAKDPAEISIGEIVRALEGDPQPLLCSMPEYFNPECHTLEGCLSRLFCNKLDGQLRDILDNTTIADLMKEAKSAELDMGQELVTENGKNVN